ncbi:MAG TPA: pitrilysin family protein [Blastocatellia bacterium]|nr:pitrilysin family protein [Blastocatellia bacterium]
MVSVVCLVMACACLGGPAGGAQKPSEQAGQPLQSSPFTLPIAKRDSLLNGLPLIVLEQPDTGKVTVHLRVNSGGLFDLSGKGGLADLTAGMLLRGGGGLSAKNVSDTVEQLGLTVNVTVGWDATDIVISGAKADVDDIFDLLNRMVITPAFDQKELDALKAQRVMAAKQEAADEAERLRRKALEGAYGSHPYGRPLTGTADSLQPLTRADLLAFHSRFYIANNAELLVQGDVSADQVTRLARARLGTWKKGEVVPPNFRQPERLAGNRVLLIDGAEAGTSRAVLALIGVSRRASNYFAATMAIDIFNQLLAQANFGATAKAEARVLSGPLTVELTAPPEKIVDHTKDVIRVMTALQAQPPALEQVEAAKSRLIAAMAERLRGDATMAEVILGVESYGLGRDYLLRYAERVNAATPADIQAAARDILRPDGLAIALSGPAKLLENDARKLGAVTVIR